jgi:hypothetical protein
MDKVYVTTIPANESVDKFIRKTKRANGIPQQCDIDVLKTVEIGSSTQVYWKPIHPNCSRQQRYRD